MSVRLMLRRLAGSELTPDCSRRSIPTRAPKRSRPGLRDQSPASGNDQSPLPVFPFSLKGNFHESRCPKSRHSRRGTHPLRPVPRWACPTVRERPGGPRHPGGAGLRRRGPGADRRLIVGKVIQTGAGQGPARQASLDTGISWDVPTVTVNKFCLSGLTAVIDAARKIRASVLYGSDAARQHVPGRKVPCV